MKKIDFPMFGYTIIVRKPNAKELVMLKENKMVACCVEYKHESLVLVKDDVKLNNISIFVHELTHAIQNLCKARRINMIEEKECVAYMMNYSVNRVLGYSYVLDK